MVATWHRLYAPCLLYLEECNIDCIVEALLVDACKYQFLSKYIVVASPKIVYGDTDTVSLFSKSGRSVK